VCSCWANWQGFDCSERTCAYDIAWATNYRQDAHYYAECSNAGICDRTTGECVCFDGFTGVACKRTVCPNDCSGHGKCRLVAELPEAIQTQYTDPSDSIGLTGISYPTASASPAASPSSPAVSPPPFFIFESDNLELPGSVYPYYNWDGDKIQACLCDGEFFGPDCSLRRCPTGDDPLTTCPEQDILTGVESPVYDKHQVQQLTISSTAGTGFTNVFNTKPLFYNSATAATVFLGANTLNARPAIVLHYTDAQGQVWTTSAISLYSASSASDADAAGRIATNIANALIALPNYKIPSVTVSGNLATTSGQTVSQTWLITFTDERTSGNQELLAADDLPLGCVTAGCSPMYQQPLYTAYTAPQFFPATAGLLGSGAALSGLTATLSADSIFDNSNLNGVDQAKFAMVITHVVGGTAPSLYPSYFVSWDYGSGSNLPAALASAGAQATNAGCNKAADFDTCKYMYIPTGYVGTSGLSANIKGLGASITTSGNPHNPMPNGIDNYVYDSGSSGSTGYGTIANGVGFNHVPVGNGLYVVLPDAYAGMGNVASSTEDTHQVILTFTVATVNWNVQEYLRSDPMFENVECSGRGTCDYTTGTCNCFEGQYGDHCHLQTILV